MPDALRGAHGFAVRVRGVPAATTALVDADELHLRDASGAAVRRLPCADIAEVRRADTDVQVTTVRGETLDIQASDASALDAELVAACCALPELTHALRSLGSTRAGTGTVRQREFFAPLLEARRRAEDAMQRRDVVAAFSAERIGRALDAQLGSVVSGSPDARPAARRALSAQLDELVEPLRDALAAMDRAAHVAAEPAKDARVTTWRAWTATLARVFAEADRVWGRLEGWVAR